MLENFLHGRRKHVWISVGNDLALDARRDLDDLGCGDPHAGDSSDSDSDSDPDSGSDRKKGDMDVDDDDDEEELNSENSEEKSSDNDDGKNGESGKTVVKSANKSEGNSEAEAARGKEEEGEEEASDAGARKQQRRKVAVGSCGREGSPCASQSIDKNGNDAAAATATAVVKNEEKILAEGKHRGKKGGGAEEKEDKEEGSKGDGEASTCSRPRRQCRYDERRGKRDKKRASKKKDTRKASGGGGGDGKGMEGMDERGGVFIESFQQNKHAYGTIRDGDGVMFLTYSSLVAANRDGKSRLKQVCRRRRRILSSMIMLYILEYM